MASNFCGQWSNYYGSLEVLPISTHEGCQVVSPISVCRAVPVEFVLGRGLREETVQSMEALLLFRGKSGLYDVKPLWVMIKLL